MIENTIHTYIYSIDHLHKEFHINIYHKQNKKHIIKNHPITQPTIRKTIYQQWFNKTTGSTYKKGNMKFLIRNHDKIYTNKTINTKNNTYDTRYQQPYTLIEKIKLKIKKTWLNTAIK